MSQPLNVHLPVFQNYDCDACGQCCRKNLVVNVTTAEREKILRAGWAARMPRQRLFISYRFHGRRLTRLAKFPDGRCIFLGDDGRCRLHAETGFEIKPLACRLYPYIPTPGADGVHIDLRADCPCVAANKGRPLNVHRADIIKLVRETGAAAMAAPPPWRGARPLSFREFEAVVAAFDYQLRHGALTLRQSLRAVCGLLDLLYTIQISKIGQERFIELMDVLARAAAEQAQAELQRKPLPPRAHHLFRQWLFLHCISDSPERLNAGYLRKLLYSWKRYGQARRFARLRGPVPKLAGDWPDTDFDTVAALSPAPDDCLEPVCRTLRIKLDAHDFAGPGYFGYDLLSGLTAWTLLPAVIGWYARLAAISGGRPQVGRADVLNGVQQAHYTFGLSPVFVRISERLRLRALARPGLPGAFLDTYGP